MLQYSYITWPFRLFNGLCETQTSVSEFSVTEINKLKRLFYLQCTDVPDDDDFMAEEFQPEPLDYIPLWYKEKVVALAAAHPKWNLKTLQANGAARLKHKETLYRWKEDVKRGGTNFDKWKTIEHETYERFVEARNNMEQVK